MTNTPSIQTVTHSKTTYPSGLTAHADRVQSYAEKAGRQEVTIEGAIQAECVVYAFVPGQLEFGLDPWRVLEGIDPWVSGDKMDVWFESGACRTYDRDDCELRFFVSAKDVGGPQ